MPTWISRLSSGKLPVPGVWSAGTGGTKTTLGGARKVSAIAEITAWARCSATVEKLTRMMKVASMSMNRPSSNGPASGGAGRSGTTSNSDQFDCASMALQIFSRRSAAGHRLAAFGELAGDLLGARGVQFRKDGCGLRLAHALDETDQHRHFHLLEDARGVLGLHGLEHLDQAFLARVFLLIVAAHRRFQRGLQL